MDDGNPKLRILVVDDQFVFREINKKRISTYLQDRVVEYEIFTADGLENALEIVKKISFDVVFTDLKMNGNYDGGLILTREIKAFNPNSDVFIVSNANMEDIAENARAAGANGCFQMPITIFDLKIAFQKKLPDA